MAPTMTNTVHVPLPAGEDAAAVQSQFERFGEILSVLPVAEKSGKVAVVFYDVNAAASAVEEPGCAYGPQTGARSVRLAEDALFDADDVWAISGSKTEGTDCILEFCDLRIAARYARAGARKRPKAAAAPPGLALPSPPKVEAPVSAHTVSLCGLPSMLMTTMMLEAMLQQAGLDDDLADEGVKVDKASGEVLLAFTGAAAAERCVEHFRRSQWAQAHGGVSAKVLRPEGKQPLIAHMARATATGADRPRLSAAAKSFQPAAYQDEYTSEASTSSEAGTPPATAMSAAAPVFVPGGGFGGWSAKKEATGLRKVNSMVSTEAGEYSSEEEKDSPKKVFPAWA